MTQLPRPSMLTDRLSVSVDVQPAPPFSRPSRPRLLSGQHVQGRWGDAETASCFNIDNNYPQVLFTPLMVGSHRGRSCDKGEGKAGEKCLARKAHTLPRMSGVCHIRSRDHDEAGAIRCPCMTSRVTKWYTTFLLLRPSGPGHSNGTAGLG